MNLIPDISFFYQLVNFLIILFVLNFLLYRPIRNIIKKRADLMSQQISDIEKFSSAAEKKMADYQVGINEAKKQGQDIRATYKDAGYAEEKKVVETATVEAATKLKSTRTEIAAQSKGALDALKAKVGQYAEQATGKILGRA